ncbi:MAG: glycosyltransferase [Planctomycetota bacterium]
MIRVCNIITRLNIGGPARQVAALTNHFSSSHLIYGSLAAGEALLPEARTLSVGQITQIGSMSREVRLLADARALRKITQKLKRLRPQIVHTHTSKAGLLGRIAAKRAGVPVIVHTFHGHVFKGYFSRPKARAILEIERRLARKSDALIVLSASQFMELTGKYHFPCADRFRVIPLGLELKQFGSLPARGKLREELGIPGDVFLAGFVGRLEPVKQPELFIEIISGIDNIHGVFAGGGRQEPDLRRLTKERGLEKRIHFAGWRDNLPAVYADLDAVALTSANEGTPVSLIEAAACGLPVVAFEVGGVGSIVNAGNERSGFTVKPGNVHEFADGLKKLSVSEKMRRDFGEAGRKSVKGRFTFERLAKDLTELYESLARSKRR